MNIKDFIGIIGTLAGVIIGGLITFFITYIQLRHQEKQNRKERKIKAYEENCFNNFCFHPNHRRYSTGVFFNGSSK